MSSQLPDRPETPRPLRRGRLRIYFAQADGAGKTTALLEEGRRRSREGWEVVARGLDEVGLDELLARRPALVLVDELARSNPAGARHRKRYQDVMELLERGIDVSCALNVQNLESFADQIESLTGSAIPERVPDALFDSADQLLLIDAEPEELLERYAAGKIHLGNTPPEAAARIYREDTLAALREMALRHASLRVRRPPAAHGRPAASSSTGRLLATVSASPNSAYLLRWTRQQAYALKTDWMALHVESGRKVSAAERQMLEKNLNLARRLGAAVVTVPSDDAAGAVVRFARENRISQIVVGKSGRRSWMPRLLGGSIADRILARSTGIDVAVVQEKGRPSARSPAPLLSFLQSQKASLLTSLLAITLVTGLNFFALPHVGYRSVSILYLLAIIGLTFFVSRPAVLLSAFLSALLWNFLFIPPRFAFSFGRLEDSLMSILFFATSSVLAFLVSRLRVNRHMLSVRERRLSLLFDFSQALSVKGRPEDIVRTGLEYTSRYFEAEVVVLLAAEGSGGPSLESTPRLLPGVEWDERERGAAQWSFNSRAPCGRYTDTLHEARFHYLPLLTPDSAVGVLGIRLEEGRTWTRDQEDSLQTLARSLALSLERERLAEANRRNLMARESERLGRVLLNTVSHELRTPLTTITGSISALMDPSTGGDPEAREILLAETLAAADRLNRIVENLLSMSRLEAGRLKLNRSKVDPTDLASVALVGLHRRLADHPLEVRIDESLSPVRGDFVLLVQALSSLLQNAADHTPPGTPIRFAIEGTGAEVRLTVSDTGPGVAPEELPHLFETFYRGRKTASGGVGLGLSICRGIVEAHGGRIAAANNPGGGLSVSIILPEASP